MAWWTWAWAPQMGASGVAVGNLDYSMEIHIPTGGRPITRMRAMEKDHHGLVDLSFGFEDGTCTPWALQDALPLDRDGGCTGLKVWEHTVPAGRWASGLGVRSQGQFGVVDVILKVCTTSAPLMPSLPTAPSPGCPSEVGTASELVQETRVPGRDGPR